MRASGGYINQGREAYGAGTGEKSCPHARGTLKNLEWTIGWNEAYKDDGLEESDEFGDEMEYRREALRADRRSLLRRTEAALPSAAAVAEAIKFPVENWPGNCYAVASRLYDSGLLKPLEETHGKARLLYGLYTGPISDDSPFAGRPISHHGWIEFDGGLVVDPTQWAFLATAPLLAAASTEHYDLAGSAFRMRFGPRPVPGFDPADRSFLWDANDPETTAMVKSFLNAGEDWDRRIGLRQMVWLANLPLDHLQQHAAPLYGFITRLGHEALIPVDNRLYVESLNQDEPAAPSP